MERLSQVEVSQFHDAFKAAIEKGQYLGKKLWKAGRKLNVFQITTRYGDIWISQYPYKNLNASFVARPPSNGDKVIPATFEFNYGKDGTDNANFQLYKCGPKIIISCAGRFNIGHKKINNRRKFFCDYVSVNYPQIRTDSLAKNKPFAVLCELDMQSMDMNSLLNSLALYERAVDRLRNELKAAQ